MVGSDLFRGWFYNPEAHFCSTIKDNYLQRGPLWKVVADVFIQGQRSSVQYFVMCLYIVQIRHAALCIFITSL